MTALLASTVCCIQIILLLALMARDGWVRRRQIGAALTHRGFVASARGLPPMAREPAFADDKGAIVYLLPPAGAGAARVARPWLQHAA